jgi:plasmid maintenance system antidote protein VapI
MAKNTALKIAFIETGKTQVEVAGQMGIQAVKLSNIVNGHLEATPEEKRALARILRRPVHQIFPEVAA